MRSSGPPRGSARLWTVAAVVLALAALTSVAARTLADGRSSPDLSQLQWARLRDRLLRRAGTVQRGTPAGLPAGRPDTAAPKRTRVPWPAPDPEVLARQAGEYAAERPKGVVELQRYRRTTSMSIRTRDGGPGTATLVNLNPTINAWYLLTLTWDGGGRASSYHLTNADPAHADLVLDSTYPWGVVVRDASHDHRCDLWSGALPSLAEAAGADIPWAALCEGRVALRLRTAGRKTSLEKVTDFLRDHVWGGEAITVFLRRELFQDAFLDTSSVLPDSVATATAPRGPAPAALDAGRPQHSLAAPELGIAVEGPTDGTFEAGRWYRARGMPGVFVSVVRPDLLSRAVLTSYPRIAGPLDEVESQATEYLLAFDLADFDLGFSLGTDHPRVDWSSRVPDGSRDPSLPGPDGIGTIAPLVATGILGPSVVVRVAATFTGGFKRSHGAFKYGPLALVNHGSHYGFIESGVVLSKLQPGLATLLVLDDGTVDMRTWTEADDSALPRLKFARQNGVPLVVMDTIAGASAPGPFVGRWGPGNWSGSQEGHVRALRAGACLQTHASRRFLIYGYFSTATPTAMARVFQAYGCRYAMLLDMNALEHTYAAVYRAAPDSTLEVEHLVRGMGALDRRVDGVLLPRFLGYADNRDFFYLLWRMPKED